MKFKIKITKEILAKSECNNALKCAFATAFNELIPYVHVGLDVTLFLKGKYEAHISCVDNTCNQINFIERFDSAITLEQKLAIPEQEFEVEILDEVIEYWHGDVVSAAQKLIDNPIMQPA